MFCAVGKEPLLIITKETARDQQSTVCELSKQRTHTLVLLLIGVLFLTIGLYLTLGGIGTTSSLTAGLALSLGSTLFFLGAFVSNRRDVSQ